MIPVEKNLEKYLLEQIPISSAMGILVNLATSERVVLSASFLKNINHKKTVFGGSLHAVATLACWSLLHVNLENQDVQIVISHSEISYLYPVATDFKAECCLPDALTWERFMKILLRKGKSRIQLTAKIFQEDALCVNYSGTFVAIKTT